LSLLIFLEDESLDPSPSAALHALMSDSSTSDIHRTGSDDADDPTSDNELSPSAALRALVSDDPMSENELSPSAALRALLSGDSISDNEFSPSAALRALQSDDDHDMSADSQLDVNAPFRRAGVSEHSQVMPNTIQRTGAWTAADFESFPNPDDMSM
jgi:hypothetical protein